MKIAVHHNNKSFSSKWIDYCLKKHIDYKIVNCYSNQIIDELKDCDALMWHFQHASPKDVLFAKQLLYSLETGGLEVFPNHYTAWHFDDKVGQKYLLESIKAPMVSSNVFYEKERALEWVEHATFPKVFKLRRGAGSSHVRLIENEDSAKKLVHRAFGKGFRQYHAVSNLKERIRKYRKGYTGIKDVLKGILRLGYTTDFDRVAGPERGYIYFQDFIPGSDHDIRVVVIGDKAFAIKRMVRENEFRASGSGRKYYDRHLFDDSLIQLAFETTKKLKSQCVAFDFIYEEGNPKIIEISYGFTTTEIDGYWDKELNWHQEKTSPQYWMIDNLLKLN